MTELWALGIEGETLVEKAIYYAAFTSETKFLHRLLIDPNVELTYLDRVHLAQFIRGDYRNSQGRRPRERTPTWGVERTKVQKAAIDVRIFLDARRERGRSIYGWRGRAIRFYARRYRISPESIENCLNRTPKNPR